MNEKPILFNTEMVKAIIDGRKTVTRRLIKPQYKGKYYPIWEYPEKLIFEKSSFMDGWWQIWNEKVGSPYTCTKAPYQIGDTLYVRETWRPTIGAMHTMSRDGKRIVYTSDEHVGYEYKAHCFGVSDFYFPDGFKESEDYEHMSEIISHGNWHPSIHMPKEAARIWLKVTDVRVERLQDITVEDFHKEGCEVKANIPSSGCEGSLSVKTADYSLERFIVMWDSTIKKHDVDRYGWDANPWVWVIEFEVIKNEQIYCGYKM